MAKHTKRAVIPNIFGTLGYLSCLLQWSWISVLFLPLLLANEQVQRFVLPGESAQTSPHFSIERPSPILIVFSLIVTVFVIVLMIIVLIRMPRSIATTGKKVTTKAADSFLPLVVHHPLKPAKKRIVTIQLIKSIKLGLVLLPFLLTVLGTFADLDLSFDVVILVAAFLAIGSLVWFSLQYLSARWLNIQFEKLV